MDKVKYKLQNFTIKNTCFYVLFTMFVINGNNASQLF